MSWASTADPNRMALDDAKNSEHVMRGHINASFVPEIVLNPSDHDGDVKKIKSNEPKTDIDFDDLLPHIGEFGRYQKILFLLMIPFAFFVAFVYFAQIFITLVPEEHWCRVPELNDLSQQAR